MPKAPCLKVPKRQAQKAIAAIRKLKLFDAALKVARFEEHVLVPLLQEPSREELESLQQLGIQFDYITHAFTSRKRGPRTLVQALEGKLPPHLLASLPRSVDVVGDVVIVEVPPELEDYKRLMGEAVLEVHRGVKSVLAKAGAVGGRYRVREFDVIAGTGETETVHKEYGCVYRLDPTRVYFSPRLSYEHRRVAEQVVEGEVIVDMFAGVGPFSIAIAKLHDDVKAYAIDLNPDAVRFLKANIAANRVEDKVIPIVGDVRRAVEESLVGASDRVIMNLPERAAEFVDVACKAIKPIGGVLHYYEFVAEPRPLERAKGRLRAAVLEEGRKIERFITARMVRPTAPHEYQIVLDARIH